MKKLLVIVICILAVGIIGGFLYSSVPVQINKTLTEFTYSDENKLEKEVPLPYNGNDYIQEHRKETIDSREKIIAQGTIAGKYKLSNIIGMSEDGRYWLFQNDALIPDGNDVKRNENATLVLWDNEQQKVLFKLKGLEYSYHIPSVFISSIKGKIYFTGDGRVLDFSGHGSKMSVEFGFTTKASSYKVIGEIDGTFYVEVATSEREHCIYAVSEGKTPQEISFLKNMHVYDICKKGFYSIEQTGNKLEKVLLYLTDFAGNKQLIGDIAKADNSCTSGITIFDASMDGRYILYSVGKTPASRAVYDIENSTSRILCPGDGKSQEIALRSFWYK